MKRFTKVCLIVCGVLAGLGLLFGIIGLSMGFGVRQFLAMANAGAFNISWSDDGVKFFSREDADREQDASAGTDSDWSSDTKTFAAASVQKLDMELDFGTLYMELSQGGDIEVEMNYRSVWGNYSRKIDCMLEEDTLKIQDSVQKSVLKLFTCESKDATLVVRIPEGKVFEEVELDIGAADVVVKTGLNSKKTDFTIGAGHMTLSGVETGELDLECGAGQMELRDVTARDISAECGLGQITMDVNGAEEEYNYEIECGIGRVAVGDSEYSGLGNSKKINNGANQSMSIDCGVGEVVVSFAKGVE